MVGAAGAATEHALTARRGGRGIALAVLCTVLFLTFLDNTVVSVALGSVQVELHAGVAARHVNYPALAHDFYTMGDVSPAVVEAAKEAGAVLKAGL